MNALTTPLVLTLLGATAFWALTAPREKARSRAIYVSVVMLALIPTFGPERLVSVAPLLTSGVLLLLAIARDRRGLRITWGLAGIWAFILLHAASQMDYGGISSKAQFLTQAIFFCLLASACSTRGDGARPVFSALLTLLPLQFVVAILEQTRVIGAVWTRDATEQYSNIALRTNELVPKLIGRSMGTFAHPILLGTFAAATAVLCLIVAFRTRRLVHYAAAAIAIATIALSGTRSAATAAIAALALYVILVPGRARILRVLLGVTSIILVFNSRLLDSVLNSEVQTSASYLHRTRVLSSVPNLLSRDDATVIFGSGLSSIDALFTQGVVAGFSTFRFFDNQYVRLLALSGLTALILFAVIALRALLVGNSASRLVLVLVLVMMASFDTLTWSFSFALTIIALAGPITLPTEMHSPRKQAASRGEHPEPHRVETSP